tara:strand:+ start:1975 stop:2667 length:693 start_codon:yes stop_codon:yes gene_type:complete
MNFISHIEQRNLCQLERVTIFECSFNRSYFEESLFQTYHIDKPNNYVGLSLKRKAEFLAGRYCAFLSLKHKLGYAISIGIGTHGEPLWPKEVVGSISHSSTRAIAAVSLQEEYKYVGIDYESIVSEEAFHHTHIYIVRPHELEALSTVYLNQQQLLTLIFSAKESLYKALYPYVACYFDFQDAQVVELDISSGIFKIELVHDIHENYPCGMQFRGLFTFIDDHVLTLIVQ